MTAFDAERCARRNRLAARREGLDSAAVTLLRAAPAPAQAAGLRYAHGTLPATPEAALALINAHLPEGAPALTAEQVYIHYAEAANNAYIGNLDPRPMFLGASTLRNIATDAATGIAFMNSHRDGGLSHPADLPMGQTFAGRFEDWQDGTQRATLGFYMLTGQAPNGASGPTTDDLHAGIRGGTIADVSVGLTAGGERVCDICGEEVGARTRAGEYLCPHVPGTTRQLTADQQAAQRARGVAKGVATYTLHNAHCGEISAVFDGAVPGAGFRKALTFARSHRLGATELREARTAYGPLWREGDLAMAEMDDIQDVIAQGVAKGLQAGSDLARPAPAGAPPDPLAAERAALAAERAQLAAERTALARAKYLARAEADVTRLSAERHIVPAQNQPTADGDPALVVLLAQALADDAGSIPTFGLRDGTRYAALLAAFADAPPHTLTREQLPVGTHTTQVPRGAGGRTADVEASFAATDAAVAALLASLPGSNGQHPKG